MYWNYLGNLPLCRESGASLEGGGGGTPPISANVGHTTSDSANVGLKKVQEIQMLMISNFNLEVRACSYGQKLSRFPRKHFDRSNNVVLFIWRNVFPLTG